MPSVTASSVAYSRVNSRVYFRWPSMVATGSLSPNASTLWLDLLARAV